jgi:hypothetical protein
MCRSRFALVLLCFVTFLSGCGRLFPTGDSTSDADLAQALPSGVSLSTKLAHEDGKSVGQKLKELGAHTRDGTLHDRDGKEIRFLQGITGAHPGPEQQEQERVLRQKYTVIDVRTDGVSPRRARLRLAA